MRQSGKIGTVVMVVLMCVVGIANAALESFDAFPNGGEGWSGDWTTPYPALQSAGLGSDFPIHDGGSYLNYLTTATGSNGVYRDFAGSVGSAAYTLTLDVRIDDLGVFWDGTNLSDRIQLYGETGTGQADAGATAAFLIMASPNYKTPAGSPSGNWQVYNGRKDGTWSSSLMVNSGIAVVVGGVYSFTIAVDPAMLTYDVTINDGATVFTRTDLGFRTSSTNPADRLVFANKIRATGAGNQLGVSYDSIQIVPEPATLALLGFGALTALYRRKCHK